jgi:hypothetical protein
MSDSFAFAVPEHTTSHFVVAAERGSETLALSAVRLLGEYFLQQGMELLGTPSLTVNSHRAADSPWDLTHVGGADHPHDAHRAQAAPHHVSVTTTTSLLEQPFASSLARAAARCIAQALNGVPVDIDTGQILNSVESESERFRLADQWLGLWLPSYRLDGLCTVSDEDINGCACVDFTTHGLRRFGLPDLQITAVACPNDLAALNLLRATAQRLITSTGHPGVHRFNRDLLLDSEDFSTFWGVTEPMWDDGPIAIQLTQITPSLLRIGPPPSFSGTPNEWLWDELPPVFYQLLNREPDPVH